jgi:Regulator of G protein signaling domain
MITRKSRLPPQAVVWPYTPDPSPRLAPVFTELEVYDSFAMSEEHFTRSKPISMASPRGGLSPVGRPTLDDVLNGTAPPPYTLSAYTAFLSEQHCLETLEFTMESKKYQEKYDEGAASLAGMPLNCDTEEGFELQQEWSRLLDIYIRPGAPREINLPAEERDDLLDYPCHTKPPPPEALSPAVKRMYDLMSDSIFIPFCNSLKTMQHAQTYNALSDFSRMDGRLDPSRLTYDDREYMYQHNPSRTRKSPPPNSTTTTTSSSMFSPSRSPPTRNKPTQLSSLSSGLGRTSGARLSAHILISAPGESAIVDDNDSRDGALHFSEPDMMSPPTTPPGNELEKPSMSLGQALAPPGPKTHRSESGAWKKMGQKIWGGGKKKNGSSHRSDPGVRDDVS